LQRRAWVPHATELVQEADSILSDEKIASAILDRWKLETPTCPGHRTLCKFVRKLREDGKLAQRTSSLPKRTGSLPKRTG
jgi:hypothetical protein